MEQGKWQGKPGPATCGAARCQKWAPALNESLSVKLRIPLDYTFIQAPLPPVKPRTLWVTWERILVKGVVSAANREIQRSRLLP
jgi:hypothetical protein